MNTENGYLIDQDDADRWLWARLCENMPKLRELGEEGETKQPGAKSLLQDLFASLFKARPCLGAPRTDNQRQRHQLLEELMNTQDFERLRLTTRLDELASAIVTADVFPKLLDAWPKTDPRDPDPNKASPGGSSGNPHDGHHHQGDSVTSDHATDDNVSGGRLDAVLRRLLKEATEKVKETQALLEAFGTQPGERAQRSIADALSLAERVRQSDLLRRVAQLAGRMKRLALSKHSARVRHGTDELVSIETGNVLERVLPKELAFLRHPILRRDFFRKFAEGSLLQYELSGIETLGKGPMIVCLDSSRSMSGDREIWAKAMSLGLLSVAAHEERDYALIHFGASVECRVFHFACGQAASHEVLEAIGFAFHGGTDFERPLREAYTLIETSPYARADVVFVTDGECSISEDFCAEFARVKAAKAFRVFSILIDASGRVSSTTLDLFSDEVFRVSELADEESIFDQILTRS